MQAPCFMSGPLRALKSVRCRSLDDRPDGLDVLSLKRSALQGYQVPVPQAARLAGCALSGPTGTALRGSPLARSLRSLEHTEIAKKNLLARLPEHNSMYPGNHPTPVGARRHHGLAALYHLPFYLIYSITHLPASRAHLLGNQTNITNQTNLTTAVIYPTPNVIATEPLKKMRKRRNPATTRTAAGTIRRR